MGDASWFPTPPRKQTENPVDSMRLFTGGMLAVVAFVAIVLALTSSHSHSNHQAPAATTTPAVQSRQAAEAERRAAFESCLKNMGVSVGSRSGFNRGSLDKERQAFSVCNSVLGGGASLQPPAPARGHTGTVTAPVA